MRSARCGPLARDSSGLAARYTPPGPAIFAGQIVVLLTRFVSRAPAERAPIASGDRCSSLKFNCPTASRSTRLSLKQLADLLVNREIMHARPRGLSSASIIHRRRFPLPDRSIGASERAITRVSQLFTRQLFSRRARGQITLLCPSSIILRYSIASNR